MDQNLFANLPGALGRRQNQQLLSFDDDMVDVAFYKFLFDNLEFLKLWQLDPLAMCNLPQLPNSNNNDFIMEVQEESGLSVVFLCHFHAAFKKFLGNIGEFAKNQQLPENDVVCSNMPISQPPPESQTPILAVPPVCNTQSPLTVDDVDDMSFDNLDMAPLLDDDENDKNTKSAFEMGSAKQHRSLKRREK